MIHDPVLLDEIVQFMKEMSIPVSNFLDGTFGRGGHTSAVLKEFSECKVVALDRDLGAIEHGQKEFATYIDSGRLKLEHTNFLDFAENLDEQEKFDAILLDLGVSSPQLDDAERGFSFYDEGPLDMRMDRREELTAEEIINSWSEDEINKVFQEYGEVRKPYRVTRAIVADRQKTPFKTTKELAGLIARVERWTRKGKHPATKFFLGLRLVVNRELESTKSAIPHLMDALRPGGRLFVISFHSLEDRIVKFAFRDSPDKGIRINKKVIIPSREEEVRNARSRSAKLRVFERNAS